MTSKLAIWWNFLQTKCTLFTLLTDRFRKTRSQIFSGNSDQQTSSDSWSSVLWKKRGKEDNVSKNSKYVIKTHMINHNFWFLIFSLIWHYVIVHWSHKIKWFFFQFIQLSKFTAKINYYLMFLYNTLSILFTWYSLINCLIRGGNNDWNYWKIEFGILAFSVNFLS